MPGHLKRFTKKAFNQIGLDIVKKSKNPTYSLVGLRDLPIKAIIDVGQAFAPGQVYVALSRLKSLDGLVLRSPISSSAIRSDADVQTFNRQMEQQLALNDMLHEKQRIYLEDILSTTFDFSLIERQVENLQRFKASKMEFEDPAMQQAMGVLLKAFGDEAGNTATFRRQLQRLLQENNPEILLERIRKGSDYYAAFMEKMLKQLLVHLAEVEQLTRTKTYRNALSEIDQQLMITWGKLEEAEHLAGSILKDQPINNTKALRSPATQRRSELWDLAQKAAEENPKFKKGKSEGALCRCNEVLFNCWITNIPGRYLVYRLFHQSLLSCL